MTTKIQTDLVGYFGFPSDDHPPPLSTSRVGKKSKRKSLQSQTFVASEKDVEEDVMDIMKVPTEEQRCAKKARVSLDDDMTETKTTELNDPLESFSDEESPITTTSLRWDGSRGSCFAKLKQPINDSRQKNNKRTFAMRSLLYDHPPRLTPQQHSHNLLRGRGTVHILSHLFTKSITHKSAYIPPGRCWNTCPIQLTNQREVTTMSFDKEGVLLATGDDGGYVNIYDFDTVNALDVRSRNERSRWSADAGTENDADDTKLVDSRPSAALSSEPIVAFRCASYRIADLQWNPDNQDQLAVAFA
jgi:hypothetical protein